MTPRIPTLPVLLVLLALLSCKKKEEQALPSATLPPPAPEAPAPAPAPAASAPAEDDDDDDDKKPATTTTKPAVKKDGGTTAKTDAGTTAKTDAGAKPTASKACIDKCNAVLQTCLTPAKKDGGFPSFGNPAQCQSAFSACQAACK
jgi:hypothetical protein